MKQHSKMWIQLSEQFDVSAKDSVHLRIYDCVNRFFWCVTKCARKSSMFERWKTNDVRLDCFIASFDRLPIFCVYRATSAYLIPLFRTLIFYCITYPWIFRCIPCGFAATGTAIAAAVVPDVLCSSFFLPINFTVVVPFGRDPIRTHEINDENTHP